MPRKRKGRPIHGWLVLDKPLEMSSSQAVGKARWLLQAQKAGHGGTLDPLATGVLPIAFGEATKTSQYAMDGRKSYSFHVRFGERRATDDAEGEVLATSTVRPSEEGLRGVLDQFIGDIDQIPPIYSALKIGGERAYALARAGEMPQMTPRRVRIDDLRFVAQISNDEAAFEVDCGKGTYVRSLARDISSAVGALGYVSRLERTRVGPFTRADAISLEKLEQFCHKGAVEAVLHSIEAVLDDIPAVPLTKSQADLLRHGQTVALGLCDMQTALAMCDDQAVALATVSEGAIKPVRVFNL